MKIECKFHSCSLNSIWSALMVRGSNSGHVESNAILGLGFFVKLLTYSKSYKVLLIMYLLGVG
jgi:hypothetical protein